MRQETVALPVGDYIDSPRMVLRDGTVASVRVATPADRESLRRFFHDLSPDSRRRRFFTASEPGDDFLQRLADAHNPGEALTLIVDRYRTEDEDPLGSANPLDATGTPRAHAAANLRPIATASYLAINERLAEVAFAVDDRFQGRGLGSMLLERLAVIAARHGFERFQASTLTENAPML